MAEHTAGGGVPRRLRAGVGRPRAGTEKADTSRQGGSLVAAGLTRPAGRKRQRTASQAGKRCYAPPRDRTEGPPWPKPSSARRYAPRSGATGALAEVRADDLAAVPIRALLDRCKGLDPAAIDDVVLGCANRAGEDNRNVARMAALLAGLPDSVRG